MVNYLTMKDRSGDPLFLLTFIIRMSLFPPGTCLNPEPKRMKRWTFTCDVNTGFFLKATVASRSPILYRCLLSLTSTTRRKDVKWWPPLTFRPVHMEAVIAFHNQRWFCRLVCIEIQINFPLRFPDKKLRTRCNSHYHFSSSDHLPSLWKSFHLWVVFFVTLSHLEVVSIVAKLLFNHEITRLCPIVRCFACRSLFPLQDHSPYRKVIFASSRSFPLSSYFWRLPRFRFHYPKYCCRAVAW